MLESPKHTCLVMCLLMLFLANIVSNLIVTFNSFSQDWWSKSIYVHSLGPLVQSGNLVSYFCINYCRETDSTIVAWVPSFGRAFGVCQHCDNLHQMTIKNGSFTNTMTRKKANTALVYAIRYPIGSNSGFFDILILTTALLLDAAVFKTWRKTHNVLLYNVPLMIWTFQIGRAHVWTPVT